MNISGRWRSALAAAIGGMFCLGAAPIAAVEGAWKFEENSSSNDDHRHLVYLDGDKEIFSVVCGGFTGFTAMYPAGSGRTGRVPVSISTAKASMNFEGDFHTDSAGVDRAVVLLDITSARPAKRLIRMIDSGLPLTVSSGMNQYMLRGSTIPDLIPRWNMTCGPSVPFPAHRSKRRK